MIPHRAWLRVVVPLSLLLILLVVTGCGKDDDNAVNPGPGDVSDLQEDADDALEDALYQMISGGGEDVDAFDVSEPMTLYNDMLEVDGFNTHAHFALAVLELVALMQDEETGEAFESVGQVTMGTGSLFGAEGLQPFGSGGIDLGLDELAAVAPLAMQQELPRIAEDTGTSIATQQDVIATRVAPGLAGVVEHMEIVTGDADFRFVVSGRMQGDPNQLAVELDRTEAYVMLASVSAVEALARQFAAYQLDIGGNTMDDVVTALTPGSPWLALRQNTDGADGETQMILAHAAWMRVLNAMEDGVDALLAETDDQNDDLIILDPYDDSAMDEIDGMLYEVQRLKQLFTTELDVDIQSAQGTMETVQMSLNSFFLDPIPDLKGLVPPYSVSVIDVQDFPGGSWSTFPLITWDANSGAEWILPDPTIGGLLPGMTDAHFKQLIGWTPADFEKQTILDGFELDGLWIEIDW